MYIDALAGEFCGDLSHKHAAWLAGLGEIGENSLLLHPDFGNRLILTSIVTSAPLEADKPFTKKLCLRKDCLLCLEACPVRAVKGGGRIDKAKCANHYRPHQDVYKETLGIYACRECRRVCPIGKEKNSKVG